MQIELLKSRKITPKQDIKIKLLLAKKGKDFLLWGESRVGRKFHVEILLNCYMKNLEGQKIIENIPNKLSISKSTANGFFNIKHKKSFIFYNTNKFSFRKCNFSRRHVSAPHFFAFVWNGWTFCIKNEGKILLAFPPIFSF